jgi:hypothetical protein
MGTRIEDQPPEHWAGPDSLDPTPVWKQFLLVGELLALGLVLVGGVAAFAVAPQFVTPPALVVGDRLVLPLSELPPAGIGGAGTLATQIGPPLVDEARTFLLGRDLDRVGVVAVRARWSPTPGGAECLVRSTVLADPVVPQPPIEAPAPAPTTLPASDARVGYLAVCSAPGAPGGLYWFDAHGNPREGTPRGLDRYLVSVTTDRVIVNLDRLIVSPGRTSAPPTP